MRHGKNQKVLKDDNQNDLSILCKFKELTQTKSNVFNIKKYQLISINAKYLSNYPLKVNVLFTVFSYPPVLGVCSSGCKMTPAVGRGQPLFVIFFLPRATCRGAGPKICG